MALNYQGRWKAGQLLVGRDTDLVTQLCCQASPASAHRHDVMSFFFRAPIPPGMHFAVFAPLTCWRRQWR